MLMPNFLIIGAMKAGTTTLYRDLCTHPDLYLPAEKEPETLLKSTTDANCIAQYASLFRHAPNGCKLGEASTSYTKRPKYEGVAERARRICGEDLKLIYLTREPIDRMVSQYRHDFGLGLISCSFEEAVKQYELYVDCSRYQWQLKPWKEAFGGENVLELAFERFVANRNLVLRDVCRFLGIASERMPSVASDVKYNSSSSRLAAKRPIVKRLVYSKLYQQQLKPLVPRAIRDQIAARLLTRVETEQVVVTPRLVAELSQRLAAVPGDSVSRQVANAIAE